MYTKAIENVTANIDLSKRRAEAIVARFGNLDHVRDRTMKGAFARTLSSGRFARGLVSTKYNHETLIGKPVHAEETDEGLLMVMEIAPTQKGDEILSLMQSGALSTYSFKYTIDKGGAEYVTDADGGKTRLLKSVELWEAGPVDPDLAVNDSTYTVGFKGLYEIAEAVSSIANLEGAEDWARMVFSNLSDEDKAALDALVGALPAVSSVIQSILSAGEGKSSEAFRGDSIKGGLDLGAIADAIKARDERIRAAFA